MEPREPLHDGKAQPGAPAGGGVQPAFLVARVLQRQFPLGEAAPGILYRDEGRAIGRETRHQTHLSALGGELHPVGQEVEHHLLQRPLVAPQAHGRMLRHVAQDDAPNPGLRRHHAEAVLGEEVQPHRGFQQHPVAALDAGEVQKVVGQGQQMLAAIMDVVGVALVGGDAVGAEHLLRHHLGKAHHRVEGRAQFVAHIGEEARLREALLLRLAARGFRVGQAGLKRRQGGGGMPVAQRSPREQSRKGEERQTRRKRELRPHLRAREQDEAQGRQQEKQGHKGKPTRRRPMALGRA